MVNGVRLIGLLEGFSGARWMWPEEKLPYS